MLAYLSDEWIAALDRALSAYEPLAEATRATTLVLQNVVTGTPDGSVGYTVMLDHGTNRVLPGRHADPDVSFTCDLGTAVAIATGAESAQGAFMAGRLRLGGDARRLMDCQHVLAELDDVFGPVRAETDFGEADERAGAGEVTG